MIKTSFISSIPANPRLPHLNTQLQLRTKEVVLNHYKHTEPLCSFPKFCLTPFFPNITESNNGLHVSDGLRRTPETASSNPRGWIEPSLRTTELKLNFRRHVTVDTAITISKRILQKLFKLDLPHTKLL